MIKKSVTKFFRKYGYYAVGFMLMIAIGITAVMTANTKVPNDGVIDVGTDGITFRLPMVQATVIKEYSGDELIENKTLKNWTTHKAYSLTSEDLKVYAVARGTVEATGASYELGNYIIIAHENGIKSFYGSLDENLLVSTGTSVEKGQLIGTASDTAENYHLDGKHLFFRMIKDDKYVNPGSYLNFAK